QEHARLLFVYTHIGKITLIARGSQKLNASSRVIAQFLTEISFQEVPHKTMYTLKEPKLINDYHHIKDDYHMTQQAALMLEIIDKFVVEDSKHEFIYEELMKALNAPSLDVSSLGFALRMLQSLGVGLSLKPDGRVIRGVNIEKGGLVYQDDDD